MIVDLRNLLLIGDVLERLRMLPDNSVDCIVTSPPYWGLRDYGVPGQLGLEETFDEYLAKMVLVFKELLRVLKPSGTCWVNMGDCYAGGGHGGGGSFAQDGIRCAEAGTDKNRATRKGRMRSPSGLKDKDLVGQPWALAFALRAAGWYLRQDIIWHKPAPMPESVRDRCTKAHEYLFLLTKSARYYYDINANRTQGDGRPRSSKPAAELVAHFGNGRGHAGLFARQNRPHGWAEKGCEKTVIAHSRRDSFARVSKSTATPGQKPQHRPGREAVDYVETANARSVWTIASRGYKGAHFATFPIELPLRCISAGCPPGGLVLDPFAGSGTTGEAAAKLGRDYLLVELNRKYVPLIVGRLGIFAPRILETGAIA